MIVGHACTDYFYRKEIYEPDDFVANWTDVVGRMVDYCAVCQRGTSCLGKFTFLRHE